MTASEKDSFIGGIWVGAIIMFLICAAHAALTSGAC